VDDYFEEEKLENVSGQEVKRERVRMDWQERDDHGCHGGESAEVCASWKLGGEMNELMFDQHAGRRIMGGLEIPS